MHGIFGAEGPLFRLGSIIYDIIILSLIWIVVSIPVVTIGASITGIYYAATLRLTDRERSTAKDFFKGFKDNFILSTLVFITFLAVAFIFGVNLNVLLNNEGNEMIESIKVFMLPLQIFFIIEGIFVFIYIFPLLSRFDLKYPELFKTALRLANKHLLTSSACVLLLAFTVFTSVITGIFTVIAVGFYCYASSNLLLKVFRKYKPEIFNDFEALKR